MANFVATDEKLLANVKNDDDFVVAENCLTPVTEISSMSSEQLSNCNSNDLEQPERHHEELEGVQSCTHSKDESSVNSGQQSKAVTPEQTNIDRVDGLNGNIGNKDKIYLASQQGSLNISDSTALGRMIKYKRILRSWIPNNEMHRNDRRDSFLERFVNPSTATAAATAQEKAAALEEKPKVTADEQQQPVADKHSVFSKVKIYFKNFVVDDSTTCYYRWIAMVALILTVNIYVLLLRAVFPVVFLASPPVWFCFDYIADFINICDIFVGSRTGYLEQGLLVTDLKLLRKHYLHTWTFLMDVLSIIPFELCYLFPSLGTTAAWLRFNRWFKLHRVLEFTDRTETRTNYPNVFRICSLITYILITIHINACVYFALCNLIGLGTDAWVYPPRYNISLNNDEPMEVTAEQLYFYREYIYCFYWSTLTLTTIGETPRPVIDGEYIFVTVDFLIGVIIFATIVGNVGSMITNMNATRSDFQLKMDGVKRYMEFRKVGKLLEKRVIRWFDYLWSNKQSLDEETILTTLPDKLKAEIAIHVHYETLKRVSIFQDCDPGLLVELVLKLKLQVFSPDDYICRKGDIGKEMYIVKRGKLGVVGDDGRQVFVTLGEGSVFGEISILNIAGNKTGNRRTANVRSVGYSDLFVLSKDNLWDALNEYPDAKIKLMQRGREILSKDKLIDEDAPQELDEEKTENRLKRIDGSMEVLQTRLGRLWVDFQSDQLSAKQRIYALEEKLRLLSDDTF